MTRCALCRHPREAHDLSGCRECFRERPNGVQCSGFVDDGRKT